MKMFYRIIFLLEWLCLLKLIMLLSHGQSQYGHHGHFLWYFSNQQNVCNQYATTTCNVWWRHLGEFSSITIINNQFGTCICECRYDWTRDENCSLTLDGQSFYQPIRNKCHYAFESINSLSRITNLIFLLVLNHYFIQKSVVALLYKIQKLLWCWYGNKSPCVNQK